MKIATPNQIKRLKQLCVENESIFEAFVIWDTNADMEEGSGHFFIQFEGDDDETYLVGKNTGELKIYINAAGAINRCQQLGFDNVIFTEIQSAGVPRPIASYQKDRKKEQDE